MADYISKVKLGSTTYFLKDTEVRAAVETLQSTVASSLVFKGVIASAAEITGLTDYKLGWTYKANANFTIPNIGKVENGDMIICINSNSIYSASDWTIVQDNVDAMNGATSTANGTKGLVPAPMAGEANRYLCSDGTWNVPTVTGIPWGNIADLI